MKELTGRASVTVRAPAQSCLDLLAALDRYPEWYPQVVRSAVVLERDPAGAPLRARVTVHVATGPLTRDFELVMDVLRSDGEVNLVRVPHEPTDPERFEVRFQTAHDGPTELTVDLLARLEVPRFLPLGSVGESLAQGFAQAAKRAIEGSSPKASATSS